MTIRRLVLGLIPSLCVLAAAGLLSSAPALAKEVHIFKSSFGAAGSGAGQFNVPTALAVNDATHDVYVVDAGNDRVQEFTAAGGFIAQFNGSGTFLNEGIAKAPAPFLKPGQIAVDNDPASPSYEDVYVVDRGHGVIDKFDSNGEYIGQITGASTPGGLFEPPGSEAWRAIQGVAVDPAGTVWVTTQGGPIYSFTDAVENKYSSERVTVFGGTLSPGGLGVDGEDNLYFRSGGGTFAEVNSAGEDLSDRFCGDAKASSVAVDPVGREVYLDSRETIEACSLSGEPIENFGAGHLTFSNGVAVDSSDGMVFASDEEQNDVSIFAGVLLPSVAIAALTEQQPRSVTLTGTVNPEGKPVTSCVFEYATAQEFEASKTYAHSVPCASASLGSGTSPVAVSAHLEGLTPQTTYDYRLSAENLADIASSTANQELFTGPRLAGQSVSDVAATSATLQDSIDPNGANTHYYIEYGPTEAYGSFAPLAPPGTDLGAAGAQSLRVHLQTLTASTTYHYRFVAVQDGEAFAEPDRVFTTQAAGVTAVLPDGRAWELVSPPNKHGALIELFEEGGQVQAAADGSGIAYLTSGPSPAEHASGKHLLSQILSRRRPGGWSTVDITPPGELPENEEAAYNLFDHTFYYHLFSPDLSLAAVEPQYFGTPPLAPEATERTLYLRDNNRENFLPLVTSANVPPGARIEEPNFIGVTPAEWEMHFLAATPDLAHIVFSSPMALTPEAFHDETVQKHTGTERQENVYEWSAGHLQLVNILPNGKVAHGVTEQVPVVGLAGVDESATGLPRGGRQRSVSSDGRRVAWVWGNTKQNDLGQFRGLYVRDMVEERTVRIGGAAAIYQTMSSDGSRVFYRENGDLWVYDFNTETQTDLTASHDGEPNAGVQEAVSDVSEDGSYVYFVATGVLAKGGVSGEDNLYLLHDTGSGWSTTYVTTLSAADSPDWFAAGFAGNLQLDRTASRVSPDGRFLAFMSQRRLTGYDNTDSVSGQPDEEVFLYDADTSSLVCASCNPTGSRPRGVFDGGQRLLVDSSGIWTGRGSVENDKRTDHWLAGSIPGWDGLLNQTATYQPRYLSDGGRLFFDSPDALVPQDTNGLEDVYEYEPAGVGGCTSRTSSAMDVYVGEFAGSPEDGCVGLISSGTSRSESAFYDASENGDDVFFDTTASLSGDDIDKAYDVYDAHVCSVAVPCETAPVPAPPCSSGDSCKAAPTPQPVIFGSPPSATFSGAGNIASTTVIPEKTIKKVVKRCLRSKKLIRGKCVKRAKKRKSSDHRRTRA